MTNFIKFPSKFDGNSKRLIRLYAQQTAGPNLAFTSNSVFYFKGKKLLLLNNFFIEIRAQIVVRVEKLIVLNKTFFSFCDFVLFYVFIFMKNVNQNDTHRLWDERIPTILFSFHFSNNYKRKKQLVQLVIREVN